jgi:hypothetical protein
MQEKGAKKLRKYRRKESAEVIAVQLDLETEGFTYQKWGGTQRCKPGDWLVNNDGEVYTIDADVFARTYRQVRTGIYRKVTQVWAEEAVSPGAIQTKEGTTDYLPGDFLVFNDEEGRDGYAVSHEKFHKMYEPWGD